MSLTGPYLPERTTSQTWRLFGGVLNAVCDHDLPLSFRAGSGFASSALPLTSAGTFAFNQLPMRVATGRELAEPDESEAHSLVGPGRNQWRIGLLFRVGFERGQLSLLTAPDLNWTDGPTTSSACRSRS